MSDFKSLSTANLPDPVIDPAAGKEASDHFVPFIYTGNGADRDIDIGMAPDFVWIKRRNQTGNHMLFDKVRGANKALYSHLSNAEETLTDRLNSFNSDGWTTGNEDANVSGHTYVAWNWKAGGTAVSNTDGSITSSVSANTTSGMSLVGFTGTGANATVGHGLDQKPEMFWVKNRDRSAQWSVYHKELGATKFVELSTTAAAASDTPTFNDTEPTATVFSVGTGNGTNASGEDLIACCFHSVDGFSKIGAYEEHYVSDYQTDPPFVYTGFAPAFLMIKSIDGARPWVIYDNARETHNPRITWLQANTNHADQTDATNHDIDFLSNGFKIRGGSGDINTTGETYIFLAFAEAPFRYSTAR